MLVMHIYIIIYSLSPFLEVNSYTNLVINYDFTTKFKLLQISLWKSNVENSLN